MAVTIVVLSADTDPLPSITFDAPRVVIGRGEGADLRLPDPSVSHRHASLRQRGSDYLIVDEGSTNGTYAGAVRLSTQSPRVLRHGEIVRVGRIDLEVRIEHGAPVTQSPLATRELALGLVSAALAAQGEALTVRVTARTAPDVEPPAQELDDEELDLNELGREYVVGRGEVCDLVLADPDCSRRHVGIVRRADGVFARDLGSKNGTKLGDEPLPPRTETAWPPGGDLRLGATLLSYEDPLASALEELENAADEPVTAAQPHPKKTQPKKTQAKAAQAGNAASGQEDEPTAAAHASALPRARRRRLDPALTDFLVATLSLVVLGLSLLGLYWLFAA